MLNGTTWLLAGGAAVLPLRRHEVPEHERNTSAIPDYPQWATSGLGDFTAAMLTSQLPLNFQVADSLEVVD